MGVGVSLVKIRKLKVWEFKGHSTTLNQLFYVSISHIFRSKNVNFLSVNKTASDRLWPPQSGQIQLIVKRRQEQIVTQLQLTRLGKIISDKNNLKFLSLCSEDWRMTQMASRDIQAISLMQIFKWELRGRGVPCTVTTGAALNLYRPVVPRIFRTSPVLKPPFYKTN